MLIEWFEVKAVRRMSEYGDIMASHGASCGQEHERK
jgi:hypothetical protein